MKACSKCNVVQAVEEFRVVQKRGKPYTNPFCKSCERKKAREKYLENPRNQYSEAAIKAREKYKETHPDAAKEAARAWRERNPEKHRENVNKSRARKKEL